MKLQTKILTVLAATIAFGCGKDEKKTVTVAKTKADVEEKVIVGTKEDATKAAVEATASKTKTLKAISDASASLVNVAQQGLTLASEGFKESMSSASMTPNQKKIIYGTADMVWSHNESANALFDATDKAEKLEIERYNLQHAKIKKKAQNGELTLDEANEQIAELLKNSTEKLEKEKADAGFWKNTVDGYRNLFK